MRGSKKRRSPGQVNAEIVMFSQFGGLQFTTDLLFAADALFLQFPFGLQPVFQLTA